MFNAGTWQPTQPSLRTMPAERVPASNYDAKAPFSFSAGTDKLDSPGRYVNDAVGAEKLASAKQAAEVRRKLISGASNIEGEQAADAIVTIGERSKEGSGQREDQKNTLASRAKQNANANGVPTRRSHFHVGMTRIAHRPGQRYERTWHRCRSQRTQHKNSLITTSSWWQHCG
jgi:hypothetical protein